MNIGFDAKRAFQNNTGLGHYSRTLINSLATYFPENKYFLFAPKVTNTFKTDTFKNLQSIKPTGKISKIFKAAWRSKWVLKDLKKNKIEIYHGLSHEIPVGINKTNIKSVVTIHDLIIERYPHQFKKIDVLIYRKKFMYACKHADKIIAISEQTKKDIIDFYKIPENKISVCYQSCNDIFRNKISQTALNQVKILYQLPDKFFLSVGSIIERKNLLNIVKAIQLLKKTVNIPLVVIGDGGSYKQVVKKFILDNNLQKDIIFLSENEKINSLPSYRSSADFPAIYQQATAMIYPSFFEGFGIPVLEALCSRLPVITSNVSCLPEAGGNAAYYVNPSSAEEIAAGMSKIFMDADFALAMKNSGTAYTENFTQQHTAKAVMNVYKSIL